MRLPASNPRQEEAIRFPLGLPLKVVAGAGTGKTLTLVERFCWVAEQLQVAPTAILAVTFTEKAAAELRSRIATAALARGLVRDRAELDSAWIGTFHALCARLLREYSYLIACDRDFRVLDELEQRVLEDEITQELRDSVDVEGLSELRGDAALKGIDLSFRIIHALKGRGLDPVSALRHSLERAREFYARLEAERTSGGEQAKVEELAEQELLDLVIRGYRRYESRLAELGALDFDGILLRTRDALLEVPAFAEALRSRFQHLIVDEFQDTSRVQLELLSLMADPGMSNVTVVGDVKQSIYGWRDADPANLDAFAGSGPALELNYRSPQVVLDAADHLMRSVSDYAGHPRLVATAAGGGPEALTLVRASTVEEEARFVARTLRQLVDGGRYRYRDCAILSRRKQPPVAFEQELRRARIPYIAAAGLGFFDRAEVRDVIAYLRVLDDPLDGQALVRVIQNPVVRLTDGEVYCLLSGRSAEVPECWDILQAARRSGFAGLSEGAGARLGSVLLLLDELMAERGRIGTSELVHHVLERSGYLAWCHATGGSELERRLGNLRKLYRMATDFDAAQTLSGLTEFVAYLRQMVEQEVEVGEAELEVVDAVRIMTIHKAKGLEFPVVFLPYLRAYRTRAFGWLNLDDASGLVVQYFDLDDSSSRSVKFLQLPEHAPIKALGRQEERRLVYVGLTRARERAYVSATRKLEPDWEAVLAPKLADRERQHDDYFRELACWVAEDPEHGLLQDAGAVRPAPPRAAAAGPPSIPAGAAVERLRHLVTVAGAAQGGGAGPAAPGRRRRLSFSEVETLITCPQRHSYIYGWKLPAPPDDLWPSGPAADEPALGAMATGTLLHRVLERYHHPGDEGGGMPRLAQLWSDAAGGAMPEQVESMLRNYLAGEQAGWKTFATEQEFNLELPAAPQVGSTPLMLRGFIDRLAVDGQDRLVVIDYKTSRSPSSEQLQAYRLQLSLYLLAARALRLGDRHADRALLLSLHGAGSLELDAPAPGAVEEAWRAVELLDRQWSADLLPADRPCFACAYRPICPVRR